MLTGAKAGDHASKDQCLESTTYFPTEFKPIEFTIDLRGFTLYRLNGWSDFFALAPRPQCDIAQRKSNTKHRAAAKDNSRANVLTLLKDSLSLSNGLHSGCKNTDFQL